MTFYNLKAVVFKFLPPPQKKEKRSGGVAWLVEGIFAKTAQIFHETCIDLSILRYK